MKSLCLFAFFLFFYWRVFVSTAWPAVLIQESVESRFQLIATCSAVFKRLVLFAKISQATE